MKFSGFGDIDSVGFFGRVEVAEMNITSVVVYLCFVFLIPSRHDADTLEPQHVVFVNSHIAAVFTASSPTQVGNLVVRAISTDMVYVCFAVWIRYKRNRNKTMNSVNAWMIVITQIYT